MRRHMDVRLWRTAEISLIWWSSRISFRQWSQVFVWSLSWSLCLWYFWSEGWSAGSKSEKEREIQNKYTAEIVKVRKSTKSHVSSSLKNLESRGLIERIQSADNKKPDDPKDLCIYVDHCNGTSASVLGQQALSNRLTMDQTLDVRSVFWYVCGHLFLRWIAIFFVKL